MHNKINKIEQEYSDLTFLVEIKQILYQNQYKPELKYK